MRDIIIYVLLGVLLFVAVRLIPSKTHTIHIGSAIEIETDLSEEIREQLLILHDDRRGKGKSKRADG